MELIQDQIWLFAFNGDDYMWERALILDQPGDALWKAKLSGFSVWKETGSVDVVLATKATLITASFKRNYMLLFFSATLKLLSFHSVEAGYHFLSFISLHRFHL